MAVVVKDAVMLSQSLESVLKSTFGPNGLDFMLTSSSGNILITNSGAVILKSLSVAHPIGRMIVDKIVCHCGIAGDGASSFVLILAEVLRSTMNSYEGRPITRDSTELDPGQKRFLIAMSQKFASLNARILDTLVLPILERLSLKVNLRTESNISVKQRVISLIKTTLCGKFPSGTVSLLSKLLAEFVFNAWSPAEDKTIHDTVLRLIDNFPRLCVEVPGIPVTSSKVLPGILIPRDFATDQHNLPLSPVDGPFKFVVLDCRLDSDDLQVNAALELKSVSALDDALIWKRTRVLRILNELKNNGVSLILSSETLADFILHFCRQLKICAVHMIPPEYTEYICVCAQINPLAEFDVYEDCVATSFVGTGVFCKRTILGQHRYVHLGVQTDTKEASPHTGVQTDTKEASLHLGVQTDTKEASPHLGVQTDTKEASLHLGVQTDTKKASPYLGVQTDTKEASPHSLLLCGSFQGICQQYSIAVLGALKTIRMAFDKYKDELKLLPGGGATEAVISHELDVYSKTSADSYEALACRVLSKGLLAIPRQLHLNSHTSNGQKSKLVHVLVSIDKASVSGTPHGVDGRTGNSFDPFEREIFEPFMGKYLLFSHLLQCVSQLLRTDQLVGAAGFTHVTSR